MSDMVTSIGHCIVIVSLATASTVWNCPTRCFEIVRTGKGAHVVLHELLFTVIVVVVDILYVWYVQRAALLCLPVVTEYHLVVCWFITLLSQRHPTGEKILLARCCPPPPPPPLQ